VGPLYQPGEGNVSTSPFDYAVASLGPVGPDFKTHPPTISGDVYSNGPIEFGENAIVQSDGYHPGNVWANGAVTLDSGVNISGSVHADGDITLGDAASIGGSSYATGSIQATGRNSKITGGAAAYGAINVQNASGVGNSSVAYGNIHVSGPPYSWGFNVGGDVASNQNITVDNKGKVIGNASAAGTVTEASGGDVQGTITQGAPLFTLTLPEIPTLVAQDVEYWQNLYKTEAQNGTLINGDYTPPEGYVNLGNTYITGNVDMKNATVLYLTGTVYVEGRVDIKSKANIVGSGKLVAVGNIGLFNKLIGDPHSMPLLMTLGCFEMQNKGDLYAVLYAPYCHINLQNWNTVTGSVVGQSIEAGQGTVINWDVDVRNIPGLPGGNVTEGNGTWIPVEQPPIIEYRGVVIDYYIVCDDENCTIESGP
jgi:hypothetical protein